MNILLQAGVMDKYKWQESKEYKVIFFRKVHVSLTVCISI